LNVRCLSLIIFCGTSRYLSHFDIVVLLLCVCTCQHNLLAPSRKLIASTARSSFYADLRRLFIVRYCSVGYRIYRKSIRLLSPLYVYCDSYSLFVIQYCFLLWRYVVISVVIYIPRYHHVVGWIVWKKKRTHIIHCKSINIFDCCWPLIR